MEQRKRSYTAELDGLPDDLAELGAWVSEHEGALPLKPDNEARIVWNDQSRPCRTAFSIVYVHGLTASQGDGTPQHQRLAKYFGCNLFLARLPGHGSDQDEAMRGLTGLQLVGAAMDALTLGERLGKKVILIGTSLGASLSILLAAMYPTEIAAVVAWSPSVRPLNEADLAAACNHSDGVLRTQQPRFLQHAQYWSSAVHVDAYRSLADVLYSAMLPAAFAKVKAPFFMAYSAKDETASASAMLAMYDQLGTLSRLKRKEVFAGGAHVIASPWRSSAAEQVFHSTKAFLETVAGIPASGDASSSAVVIGAGS